MTTFGMGSAAQLLALADHVDDMQVHNAEQFQSPKQADWIYNIFLVTFVTIAAP